ncbi:MAG TPA: COX15/CtaA family protein [Candidatus Methylomirabilis sp.]
MGEVARGGAAVWGHRMAVLTAWATLALIFVGGVVTNTGSGLAVPDWPTTFGHSMFLYPWSRMVGGVLYEHSHRLIGSLVGLLTMATAAALWRAAPRRLLRALGLVAVGAVIAQGVLGGLRVVLLNTTLAVIHGIMAQTFFAFIAGLAVRTSREWAEAARGAAPAGGALLRRLCLLTLGLVYLQVVLGAVLTHTGALLHAHLLVAALVAVQVLWLTARILGTHPALPGLARPARVLAALVMGQLLLGLGSYVGRFTALGVAMAPGLALAFPVLHRMGGTLLLGAALVLALRAHRVLGMPEAPPGGRELAGEVAA